jgi:hypothetical protein
MGTKTAHCLDAFATLVRGQTARETIVSSAHTEAAIAAYLAAELAIMRALCEGFDGAGRQLASAASGDFLQLQGMLSSVSDQDFTMLVTLLSEASISAPQSLAKYGATSDYHASLLFTVLWALGKYALVLDCPDLWSRTERGGPSGEVGPENILAVRSTEDGVTSVVRVATTTHDGFHRIAEARHEVDEYVGEVEDLWRRAGSIAPPLSVRVEFPMWRERSLESYHLRVDAKPIARLLMGKALYGSREHIWIRELLQNALDATEMRRATLGEGDYTGAVRVRLLNPNLVEVDDNGVGMDHQHIVTYLATLGRSSWRTSEPSSTGVVADASFFGRFGIGFASVFSVARAVHVKTRRSGSRSVDGLSVQFSDPERPFFVEPLVCAEGTSVSVTLVDQLSVPIFRQALRDLFVYLPKSEHVEPDAGIPNDLDDVSIISKYPQQFDSRQTAASVRSVTLGSHRATLKVELAVPRVRLPRSAGAESPKIAPATGLAVSVSGMRVFEQDGLRLHTSGRPKEEVDSTWRQTRDFGLRNCFVTLDFDREMSPVRPSRDAIDIDDTFVNELRLCIENQVGELVPELLAKLGTDDGPEARRAAFIRTLDAISRYPESWGGTIRLYYSEQLLARIASLYAAGCPVMLRTANGERQLKALSEIEPATCSTAVVERICQTSAFSVYERAASLSGWLVVADLRELGVLQVAWPHSTSLRAIVSASNLFQRYDLILPELRSMKLCKLLRGDYALSNSPIFGEALFVHLPSDVQSVARHLGAARRRSDMDSSQTPRVVLYSGHKLTAGLEEFLAGADDRQMQQLGTWLDSFCDGVIEDKTKLAPTARWNRLIEELKALTGIDLRGTTIEKLQLTV